MGNCSQISNVITYKSTLLQLGAGSNALFECTIVKSALMLELFRNVHVMWVQFLQNSSLCFGTHSTDEAHFNDWLQDFFYFNISKQHMSGLFPITSKCVPIDVCVNETKYRCVHITFPYSQFDWCHMHKLF